MTIKWHINKIMLNPFISVLFVHILIGLIVYRFWCLPIEAKSRCHRRSHQSLCQSVCRSLLGDLLSRYSREFHPCQYRIGWKGLWPSEACPQRMAFYFHGAYLVVWYALLPLILLSSSSGLLILLRLHLSSF